MSGYKRPRVAAGALALLCGCMSVAERVDEQARAHGFRRTVVAGAGFIHLVYGKRSSDSAPSSVLHVYIENDGIPWLARQVYATDPTPPRPLMLGLMALDSQDSIYLGRPCWFGVADRPPCTPLAWTHERYSEPVVASMVVALRHELSSRPANTKLAIFGHSGGGALAMLIAERMPEAVAVVTLAGNLDVRAWTDRHGFTPLVGSLDPRDRAPLPATVVQKHYVGTHDRNVPPALARRYASGRPGAQVIELPGLDHDCCWREVWHGILRELDAAR